MPKKPQGPSGTSPPWQQLNITPTDLQDLKTQSSLLHLLHHRSSNQHRRSSWYRPFSLFRKQLRLALSELDPEIREDALPSRRFKVFREAMGKLEVRLKWWADVMVERWWRAFQGVVGDKQFAVLGVVLMAVLGRVVVVLGVLERLEVEGDDEGVGMVEQLKSAAKTMGGNAGAPGLEHDLGVPLDRHDDARDDTEDIGVVVSRDGDIEMEDHDVKELKTATATTATKVTTTKAKSTKKKRKGGDEIDDLFAGLF
jgi:hypothetical protein